MPRSKDYSFDHKRMRALRLRKMYWRQKDLADAAGLSMGQVSRIESGCHQPQLANVRRIAEVLGVEVDDLVQWHVGPVND